MNKLILLFLVLHGPDFISATPGGDMNSIAQLKMALNQKELVVMKNKETILFSF